MRFNPEGKEDDVTHEHRSKSVEGTVRNIGNYVFLEGEQWHERGYHIHNHGVATFFVL